MACEKSTDEYIAHYNGLPVKSYSPTKDEVIVVNYEYGKVSIDEMCRLFDSLQQAFPNNKTFLIPDCYCLKMLNESQLLEMRDNLLKMIDELLEGKNPPNCNDRVHREYMSNNTIECAETLNNKCSPSTTECYTILKEEL